MSFTKNLTNEQKEYIRFNFIYDRSTTQNQKHAYNCYNTLFNVDLQLALCKFGKEWLDLNDYNMLCRTEQLVDTLKDKIKRNMNPYLLQTILTEEIRKYRYSD